MITEISLDAVASFKASSVLKTDKKVNLIYGLNGAGKSTFSNYFYNREGERFAKCSMLGLTEAHQFLVYNQVFIHETFFEAATLKGIFTLSKENKEAETKIEAAQKKIREFEAELAKESEKLESEKQVLNQKYESARNFVWKVKTDYSGGDRVLEFCLEGHKGSKDALYNYLVKIPNPTAKPKKTVDELKIEIQAISGDHAQKYSGISQIVFTAQHIESEQLFAKTIVGNENSSVADLIQKLGNSDWVKAGLTYLPPEYENNASPCPFCQTPTITEELISSINDFFDASYEADVTHLKSMLVEYKLAIESLPQKSAFESNPKYVGYKADFESKYNTLFEVLKDNLRRIENKIASPSSQVSLTESLTLLRDVNEVIKRLNASVLEHNKNIDQKEKVRTNIKTDFWMAMRWEYHTVISSYASDNKEISSKISAVEARIKEIQVKLQEQNSIISEQQKNTVNIQEAIANINEGLENLGILDFRIKHYQENLYSITRGDSDEKVFRSLSEGEKTIISFLYFIELCKGKKEASETGKKKIIVIDDPISSLSHIYVFNIGRLIKNEFYPKKETKKDSVSWSYKYEQVFILTHSLYFFYEITDTNHEHRKELQNLYRISKNESGSSFNAMKYEEVQNDYQAYWQIIKDEKQHPALIANCMRNVIEYFFNFVEKKDLNNFFNQKPLNSNRYQAFYRYINRESHSLGQNIFDFKEFNYVDFKDAFAELFKVTGYEAHYKKMIC